MAKQVLGKGLGALISGPASVTGVARPPPLAQPDPGDVVQQIALDEIIPSPLQPRKSFVQEHLEELMSSIREHGIIQPLIVRRVRDKLELIAGERRFRASTLLGLKQVPVIIRQASDQDVLEMALIENLQREDLNPIEEGRAYERLAKDFGLRQEDIAQRVGKSRAAVANMMRLLDLSESVKAFVAEGQLSAGHAKVLLGLKSAADQQRIARDVVDKGLSVRATEKLMQSLLNPPVAKQGTTQEVHQSIHAVEQKLISHFKTNVNVQHTEKKGRIEIDYYGVEDLNRLLELLGVEEEAFD